MNEQIGEIIEDNIEFPSFQKNIFLKIYFLIFIILYGNLILLKYNNKISTYAFLIKQQNNNFQIDNQIDFDYKYNNFAIIKRTSSRISGLFSDYKFFLGCLRNYMIQGFIPIFDLGSYKNVINGFEISPQNVNPWEYYFNQPFGYEYINIKKKARNIKYFECRTNFRPNSKIYINLKARKYWQILAKTYMPIKREIIKESNNIIKRTFKDSRNILGVLLRGTDYIARMPKGHSIPPKTEDVIKDVKVLDKKYKYDWIFLATEDDFIRQYFSSSVGIKVKYLLNKENITYNFSKKKFLAYNIDFKKNINFNKIYLLNIIILSKCLDFVGARTSETIGVFLLTKGFRYYKVYNLGRYK